MALLGGPILLNVSEKFLPIAEKLKQALKEFDYELLEAEKIKQPLSFQTKIPTIYSEPGE